MKIGAKIDLFNHNLRVRRKELGMTLKRLSIDSGVSVDFIQSVEKLRMVGSTAKYRDGLLEVKEKLVKIAAALDCDFEYLFPDDYLLALQNKILFRPHEQLLIVKDVSFEALPEFHRSLLPSPEEEVEALQRDGELSDNVNKVLSQLTKRERTIIEMRYGFGDENVDGKTLEECASRLDVTRERIRQIENKALRKLRHPHRSGKLRKLLA